MKALSQMSQEEYFSQVNQFLVKAVNNIFFKALKIIHYDFPICINNEVFNKTRTNVIHNKGYEIFLFHKFSKAFS